MPKKLVVVLMAALCSFSVAGLSFADEPKPAAQPCAGKEMKKEEPKKAKKAGKKAAKKDGAPSAGAPAQQPPELETPIVKPKPAPSAR